MSEKDKKIMETFGKVVPNLSEFDKEKLLAFGEGIALMADRLRDTERRPNEEAPHP